MYNIIIDNQVGRFQGDWHPVRLIMEIGKVRCPRPWRGKLDGTAGKLPRSSTINFIVLERGFFINIF